MTEQKLTEQKQSDQNRTGQELADQKQSDQELTEEILHVLRAAGAVLVGIGDMSQVMQSPLPVGIAAALPVPAAIVEPLKSAPVKEYLAAIDSLNQQLDAIVEAGQAFLQRRGYQAIALTTKTVRLDRSQWTTPLPHKTVATRAGLGWIGKNCLLITKEYGSAVRITSLLTDAPLTCSQPMNKSQCGTCSLCVQACPAQALSGKTWNPHVKRDEIVDVHKCHETQKKLMLQHTGIDTDLCGKCFAVCAFTQRYLSQARH